MMYSKLSNFQQDQPFNTITHNPATPEDQVYQPGFRLPMDNSPSTSVYTPYEELPDHFKGCINFASVFESLREQCREDMDWKTHFDVTENLRILNKYHPREVADNIHYFALFISRSIDNLRSNLSKNTLLLVKEICENFKQVPPNEEFVDLILPKVLEKGISDKSFIKSEARGTLKAVEAGGCFNSVIKVLCEKSFDKNVNISELSFQTLAGTIKEARQTIETRLNQQILEIMFQTLIGAINGKRAANKRLAEDLCQQLRGGLPENEGELDIYLKDKMNLKEQGSKTIIKAMQTKKEKPVKVDFSAFIREKKLNKGGFEDKIKVSGIENQENDGDEI